MLEAVGLTEHEERLYFELLREPGRTRAELIAALPDWPESRTVRTLRSLISRGLGTSISGMSGMKRRYSPVAPDVALELLSRRQLDRVREVQQQIPDLMRQFWWIHRTWGGAEGGVDNPVEVLSGDPDAARARGLQLQADTRELVRGFVRRPYAYNPTVPAAAELDSLRRGVRYFVVYEQEEIQNPQRWADLAAGITAGEQARCLVGLPLKLTLFDDLAATAPVAGPTGEWVATIVVRRSPLLDALSALFDAYWARAVPVAEVPALAWVNDAADVPGEADRREGRADLVRLLAAGFTDESIARTLRLSRSTVQRRVNDLMDELGVRTRFQLGLQVGRRVEG